jgi:hypothetical protein
LEVVLDDDRVASESGKGKLLKGGFHFAIWLKSWKIYFIGIRLVNQKSKM